MAITYSLTHAPVLEMTPKIPEYYKTPIITGATISCFQNNAISIVDQELSTTKAIFCRRTIRWDKPQRVWTHYHYEPGIFIRIGIDHELTERINGIGNFDINEHRFTALAGKDWLGSFFPREAGIYSFIDLWWSVTPLKTTLYEHPELKEIIERINDGYPDKIVGPLHTLTQDMKEMINEIVESDHSNIDTSTNKKNAFNRKMQRLGRLMIKELVEMEGTRKSIRQELWEKYKQAKLIIDADPYTHITAKALGLKVGLNEYDMKTGIKIVTRTGLDEYRRTVAIKKTAKEMLESDKPVKYFSSMNGFSNPSYFTVAFKAVYGCTPKELRNGKKGIITKPAYEIKDADKFIYGTLIARFMGGRLTPKQRRQLDEWLLAEEDHLLLFEDLIDETSSESAQKWFTEAGVKWNFINWKKEGGWQETDTYERDKRRFIIGVAIAIVCYIFYYLDLKYNLINWYP